MAFGDNFGYYRWDYLREPFAAFTGLHSGSYVVGLVDCAGRRRRVASGASGVDPSGGAVGLGWPSACCGEDCADEPPWSVACMVTLDRLLNRKRLAYAWITAVALWGAWLASILLGRGPLDLAGHVVGTDFLEFYTAGYTLRLGESGRLYDIAYQSQLQQSLIGPALKDYYAFITPPFLAWLYRPLAGLPYSLGFAVWSLFGLLCLWAALRWLGAPGWRPLIWSLTFFPVFASVSYGQNSLLSLALLSLTYRLWRARSPLGRGIGALSAALQAAACPWGANPVAAGLAATGAGPGRVPVGWFGFGSACPGGGFLRRARLIWSLHAPSCRNCPGGSVFRSGICTACGGSGACFSRA